MRTFLRTVLAPLCMLFAGSAARGAPEAFVWWEAETAREHTFPDSGAFRPADAAQRALLSGGDWLQTDRGGGASAAWAVEVPEEGAWSFWTRKFWKHGPFEYRWNGGAWRPVGRDVELADHVVLRTHVTANWVYLGEAELRAGENVLEIRAAPDATAIAFDCWLLERGGFTPRGRLRPGERMASPEAGWFAWDPPPEPPEPALDLRGLNQARAGDGGFVVVRGDGFVFEDSGESVRFWGVNVPASVGDRRGMDALARRLARLGVNAVRVHGFIADREGDDPAAIDEAYLDDVHYLVHAMAGQGIYTALSFYFPLWMDVKPSDRLPGYRAGQKPFGLLFFDRRMQDLHRAWMREMLTRENPYTGRSLAEDPAVAIVEIVNEDSMFFWTFEPGEHVPTEAMRPLEERFGAWLTRRYGSLEAARKAWGNRGGAPEGDAFGRGRVRLYGAGMLTGERWARRSRNEKRASDQLAFMAEAQRGFYADAVRFMREELGVRCAILASNWRTADDRVLGAIERWTYAPAGVVARNAYFGGRHEGEGAAYDVRDGHVYEDRTGLRGPGAPGTIAVDVQSEGMPQIVTEHGVPMPNRFRAEGAWLAAAYGSLAGMDGFFHFAADGPGWALQLGKFTAADPAVMGQFPALAAAYRLGYLEEGPVVHRSEPAMADLLAFRGAEVWPNASPDALRAQDVPERARGRRGAPERPPGFDPLALLVGRVEQRVADGEGAEEPGPIVDPARFIQPQRSVVVSATRQLVWDHRRGIVLMNAPRAQGVLGFLSAAGAIRTSDLVFEFENEYAAAVCVPLDGRPLAESARVLLQVMTEARNAGWRTAPAGGGAGRIESVGGPPVLVAEVRGRVSLQAGRIARAVVIDGNGGARGEAPVEGGALALLPDALYYVLEIER